MAQFTFAQTAVQEQQSTNAVQEIGLQPQHKEQPMDETRINAAVAELNAMIQSLIQRNINLAGDLAVAQKQIEVLNQPKEPQS